MLTGEIRSKIDQVWNAFWAGGIANPLEVIEQITYLLFMRGLDDIQTREENKANMLGRPIERVIFPEGVYRQDRDGSDVTYQELRWSRLKNENPARMFLLVSEFVFPFLREMAEAGTAHSEHMRGARFTIPTPGLLAKVVDMLAEIPLEDRDTKGDLYEYMLGKIASAGQNGQFRTPRHIIKLMVELMKPTPQDVICDPASGTCGFLVAAGEYLRGNHKGLFRDAALNLHFHGSMFHGYDFDQTMLRIGSMNMQLHGVEGADIRYRDSLSSGHADDADKYSLILANPPFAGSLDYETTANDLLAIVKTKKTELLFMALFLKLLKPGGRAAVIVPDGVLFGSSAAHKAIRMMLVDDHKLDAIVKLPSGVFKPYAGVSTAIVFFTKTNSGGTDHVWFYDVQADGMSLDDKRQMLVPEEKFGPVPKEALREIEHARNNLPDVVSRWAERAATERENPRTGQSFAVAREEIAAADYDLSLNRYREVTHEATDHRPPKEIIAELRRLEDEIAEGLKELEAML
ncbi:SAM-dependent DNA methyltransferase [Rhizobium laguerreae]|uniref:type I restriction-modification system subunit M n=1 Tax=Rhizobium laguerreae TaxID=1076926 RepID=UPI001C91D3C1|nr:class I SAM-dependent DNA methyltransferase [Rhizobium laguerreae]MBY3186674.1 SAM-dependent DNA methyltransferase [Rhizobium laguerreae]